MPTVFEWLNKFENFTAGSRSTAHGMSSTNLQQEPQRPRDAGRLEPPREETAETPRDALLRRSTRPRRASTRRTSDDSFLQVPLLDYVQSATPRVLFVGYGETDNWAHQGRYDLVLDSAHRFDRFVKELWDTMQAMPQYRGSTTFIITADHGRGSG